MAVSELPGNPTSVWTVKKNTTGKCIEAQKGRQGNIYGHFFVAFFVALKYVFSCKHFKVFMKINGYEG